MLYLALNMLLGRGGQIVANIVALGLQLTILTFCFHWFLARCGRGKNCFIWASLSTVTSFIVFFGSHFIIGGIFSVIFFLALLLGSGQVSLFLVPLFVLCLFIIHLPFFIYRPMEYTWPKAVAMSLLFLTGATVLVLIVEPLTVFT